MASVFCRHAFSLRSPTNIKKRLSSTRHREPYVLPRLVIDLDAADSKYVRKAEELEEWYPKNSVIRKKEPATHIPRSKKSPKIQLPLDMKQVTPSDLLAFALLGDPTMNWNADIHHLRKIYRYRKIQADDSITSKALQLSSDFKYHPEERIKFEEAKRALYRSQLSYCAERGFHDLKRMVSLLSATKEGCLFLADEGKLLLNAIRSCRRFQQPDSPKFMVTNKMVLVLYNNLRINMDSKGVEFGPSLAHAALYYAANCWNLPAIRIYLELLSKNMAISAVKSKVWFDALRALEHLVRKLLYEPEMAAGQLGTETLKLITGWDNFTSVTTYDRAASSFMYCWHNTPLSYAPALYLAGLAELKLGDTLTAEWQADSKHAIGTHVWKPNSRLKAELFALAFQLAQYPEHALAVLNSTVEVEEDDAAPYSDAIDSENGLMKVSKSKPTDGIDELLSLRGTDQTTGSLLEVNDGIDEVPSEESTESPSSQPLQLPRRVVILTSFFNAHYRYHNLKPAKNLQTALRAALMDAPSDPQQFLDMAEKFLIRDFRAPIGYKQHAMEVQWIDKGRAGLFIFAQEGGDPIYWKLAPLKKSLEELVAEHPDSK